MGEEGLKMRMRMLRRRRGREKVSARSVGSSGCVLVGRYEGRRVRKLRME